jgi:hypothetical protein
LSIGELHKPRLLATQREGGEGGEGVEQDAGLLGMHSLVRWVQFSNY